MDIAGYTDNEGSLFRTNIAQCVQFQSSCCNVFRNTVSGSYAAIYIDVYTVALNMVDDS